MAETVSELLAKLAGLTFFLGSIQHLLPSKLLLFMQNLWAKFLCFFYPYIQITFNEYTNGMQNEAYESIKTYLGANSRNQARCLKADKSRNSKSVVISLDDGEEIIDEFQGIKLKWQAYKEKMPDNLRQGLRSNFPRDKNYYVLSFHKKLMDIVTRTYLDHVVEQGKEIEYRNRRRKLYTNKKNGDWYWDGGSWSCINFEHPSTFDTVAMDPQKKREIINDLKTFRKGKDYYAKIGKAWKRGYLLYGPPGTGKSTLIAAIANFMEYDIYDLELTSVKSNGELKDLLIETRSKSIIVIEDIDCSLDLTGKRKKKKESSQKVEEEEKDSNPGEEEEDQTTNQSKVTLSGLLNFIDGIWSACGQERIIIFTTNHKDKLDPALIRRGRMDMHIEMSYCKFEAFKVFAKNYLDIDSHPLFEEIERLLEETNTSPCDVAENLMPKTDSGEAEACLRSVIEACKAAKEKTKLEEKNDAKAKKFSANVLKKLAFFKRHARPKK